MTLTFVRIQYSAYSLKVVRVSSTAPSPPPAVLSSLLQGEVGAAGEVVNAVDQKEVSECTGGSSICAYKEMDTAQRICMHAYNAMAVRKVGAGVARPRASTTTRRTVRPSLPDGVVDDISKARVST